MNANIEIKPSGEDLVQQSTNFSDGGESDRAVRLCCDITSMNDKLCPSTVGRPQIFTRVQRWLRSFLELDPRHQILRYFAEVSQRGANWAENEDEDRDDVPKALQMFRRSNVFTVWRFTSDDAIRKMMMGYGTGKGLDIKGKSARAGKLSGYVPFLQIHENRHKTRVCAVGMDKTLRIYYPDERLRDAARTELLGIRSEMIKVASERVSLFEGKGSVAMALAVLQNPGTDYKLMAERRMLQLLREGKENLRSIKKLDQYASKGCYGLELPEKVFWEGYVVRRDISRKPESQDVTDRPSMPDFQDMNFEALRKYEDTEKEHGNNSGAGSDAPSARPVLWHAGCNNSTAQQQAQKEGVHPGCMCTHPMCPLTLLMAYEEHGNVKPVVSDFDCFLLGTRGVGYHTPLPEQDVAKLNNCLDEIERILEAPVEGLNWTSQWLEVMKKALHRKKDAFNERSKMPKFGYADPLSYSIMAKAVDRVKESGSVRHGPECFNYVFPVELEHKYLIISSTLPGNVRWKSVNSRELNEFLCEKVDEGFTFPLNPKWILCDEGWKEVYHKLWSSTKLHVQESLGVWYPHNIRRRIESMAAKYPNGFVNSENCTLMGHGHALRDLAEQQLDRIVKRRRGRGKLRKLRSIIQETTDEYSTRVAVLLNEDIGNESTKKLKAVERILGALSIERPDEGPTNIMLQAEKNGIMNPCRRMSKKHGRRLSVVEMTYT